MCDGHYGRVCHSAIAVQARHARGAGAGSRRRGPHSAHSAFFSLDQRAERVSQISSGEQRRAVLLSLPLVFLAYALGALVTGIVLYTIRGVTIANMVAVTRQFEVYTRWTVMGTLGAMAGLLVVSTIISRR